MSKKVTKNFKSENGMTLVESLAATAILSIVAFAFLTFFTQAARTNERTNNVNEATFLAQTAIEEATSQSSNGSLEAGEREIKENGYRVYTSVEEDSSLKLYKVIVRVEKGGKILAQMETRLSFSETRPD